MEFLYLTLIPTFTIIMLLIFNKNFSKKYNVKSAVITLLVFFVAKIVFIITNLNSSMKHNVFLMCLLVIFYIIFPFVILHSYNIKRKRTITDKIWVKLLLVLLIILSLLLITYVLMRIKFNY